MLSPLNLRNQFLYLLLLLIEAMKVFNPILAPKAGRILQILISGGSPVEFGEPLVIIE